MQQIENTTQQKTQLKITQLMNDEVFCRRFYAFTYKRSLRASFQYFKSTGEIPSRAFLSKFIEEYKILESDPRSPEEIRVFLLSNVE